jgi:hypothetical protein
VAQGVDPEFKLQNHKKKKKKEVKQFQRGWRCGSVVRGPGFHSHTIKKFTLKSSPR